MDYYGYAGTILHVNLTTGEIRKEPLDMGLAENYIGGLGINGKLAYNLIGPEIDAFSPENPIIFGAGTLVGTFAPGSPKFAVTTRFPLTGAVRTPIGSMSFGHMLKRAGYDHLIINGKANSPTYLKIIDDDVMICDARHLWGKDIYQATDLLRDECGKCSVICTGPAGENLVKFAITLVDKTGSLGGHGGLGAVMGSKNLKAVVARGTKRPAVADPERFTKIAGGLRERALKYPLRQKTVDQGLMVFWDMFVDTIHPWKNWTENYSSEKATKSYGPEVFNKIPRKSATCPSCPVPDRHILRLEEGEFSGIEVPVPSFLNISMIGTRFDLDQYPEALKLTELLDRYGMCAQTFTNLADFLIDLYERGIITDKETHGLALKRDFDTARTLIEQIARRQGFGDILADGWLDTIKSIGKGSEKYAMLIKGDSLVFDPRLSGMGTMEFEQVICPGSPADAAIAGSPTYMAGVPLDQFRRQTERMVPSKEAFDRIFDSPLGFSVGRLARYAEDFNSIFACLGICQRAAIARLYNLDIFAQLYSAATGIESSPQDLLRRAERSWNVQKAISVRDGATRKEDTFPEQWFQPMKAADGHDLLLTDYYKTKTLSKEYLNQLLDEYYEERGWNITKGIPTKEKLIELGLDEVAEDLAESGHI